MSYSSLAYAKGQCRPDELNYKGRVYRAEVAAGSEGDSSQVAFILQVFVVWLGTVQMEDIKNLLSLPGLLDDAWASVSVTRALMSTLSRSGVEGGRTSPFLPGLGLSQTAMHTQLRWFKRYGHDHLTKAVCLAENMHVLGN